MSSQKKASFGFLMRIVKILILEDPLQEAKKAICTIASDPDFLKRHAINPETILSPEKVFLCRDYEVYAV